MKFLQSVVLVAFAALAVQALPSAVQTQMQSTLTKYMEQASMDATNPELSAQCFALYLPALNEIATSFSSEYQACITLANNKTLTLTEQASQTQTVYKNVVSDICSTFSYCNNETDVVAFFNCYSGVAQEDVSVFYNLSTNAASSATTLQDGIKQIQQDQTQCTSTTESNYVRDTASTYDLLDSCLKNGVPTTTSTVAPSTSSSVADDESSSSSSPSPSSSVAPSSSSGTTTSTIPPVV